LLLGFERQGSEQGGDVSLYRRIRLHRTALLV
jgi:hypothetical protein